VTHPTGSMIRGLRYYGDGIRLRYFADLHFVHINKTGGSSIEQALGLPFRHDTALEIRAKTSARRWAKRFSFTIVRNRWDKVASHFHYRVQTNQTGLRDERIEFSEWVLAAYGERVARYHDKPKMFMPQTEWISDERGEIMVDFVGRFESLQDDFDTICARIGRRAQLPHMKRSNPADYRTLYTVEAAEVVARRFADDLENFGYTFDRAG
jgi:chondroitin 4-sulfotransferase 11